MQPEAGDLIEVAPHLAAQLRQQASVALGLPCAAAMTSTRRSSDGVCVIANDLVALDQPLRLGSRCRARPGHVWMHAVARALAHRPCACRSSAPHRRAWLPSCWAHGPKRRGDVQGAPNALGAVRVEPAFQHVLRGCGGAVDAFPDAPDQTLGPRLIALGAAAPEQLIHDACRLEASSWWSLQSSSHGLALPLSRTMPAAPLRLG